MQLNFSAPKELVKRLKQTKPEGVSLSAHIKKCVEGGLSEDYTYLQEVVTFIATGISDPTERDLKQWPFLARLPNWDLLNRAKKYVADAKDCAIYNKDDKTYAKTDAILKEIEALKKAKSPTP